MTAVQEILAAEPTVIGYLGAGLLHGFVWLALSSWEWGAVKHIHGCCKRRAPRLYHETLRENYEGDDFLEAFGCGDDPPLFWFGNLVATVHHATAGLLMLIGILTGQAWIWRHGLLTQLCGMDVADFARLLWCKLCPPGPFPMCNMHDKPQAIAFLMFHHTVSLLAGLPGSVYLQDGVEFQWMGFLLCGGPLLFHVVDLLSKCVPKRYRLFQMASGLYIVGMFAIQRIVMFLPFAWELHGIVQASSIPLWAKASLYMGGANMTLFNFLCSGACFYSWFKKYVLTNGKDISIADCAVQNPSEQKELPTLLAPVPHDGQAVSRKHRTAAKEDVREM